MATKYFSNSILIWFENNQRNLPWRDTKDPYKIWLSEVILQQTRVAQGLPYFLKFVERFPTVEDLSLAEEDEVLKLWQGLGYYSRARNMLKTAQMVVKSGKKFPTSYKDLIRLKGIGEYTASAVASFSSNEHVAVVDGNVYRVLSRYFGIEFPIDLSLGKKKFREVAFQVLPSSNSDQYNQAIMEFGALQCKPKRPDCSSCPLAIECIALQEDKVDKLPIKSKKQSKKKINLHYLVFTFDDQILIRQRRGLGVWEGLYDFAAIETTNQIDKTKIHSYSKGEFNFKISEIRKANKSFKHVLSHIEYNVQFWEIGLSDIATLKENYKWISKSAISEYPVSRLVEKYLER